MLKDLLGKDKMLYNQNGILHMLERNKRIKLKPERFQEYKEQFDIIFTVEERIFDQVIEDLENREKELNKVIEKNLFLIKQLVNYFFISQFI